MRIIYWSNLGWSQLYQRWEVTHIFVVSRKTYIEMFLLFFFIMLLLCCVHFHDIFYEIKYNFYMFMLEKRVFFPFK